MKFVVVIPSRYGASRFPGKPLAEILGKPMIQWVVEGVLKSNQASEIILATDNEKIADAVSKTKAKVIMTPSDLPTGSDRVWKAVKNIDCDWVINVQGDEPLIDGEMLDGFIHFCQKRSDLEMATLVKKIKKEELSDFNIVKVVQNKKQEAIYFSRHSIPFSRDIEFDEKSCLKHIGIYAYKKTFLKEFCNENPCLLEKKEGLEQLRALYMGAKIGLMEVDYESWGVDVPEDIPRVEKMIKDKS